MLKYRKSHKLRTALWSCFISGLVVLILLLGITFDIKKEFSELSDYNVEAVATVILAGASNGGYTENPLKHLLNLDAESFRSPHYLEEEYVLEDEKSLVLLAVQEVTGTFSYQNEPYWIDRYKEMLDESYSIELGDRLPVGDGRIEMPQGSGLVHDRWELRVYRKNGRSAYLAINQAYHKDEYIELMYLGAVALPVVAIVVAIGGWLIGHFAVKPITQMSNFVSSIKTQDLGKRMPQGDRQDEIGELATLINAMLERIENGYEQAKRFTADASHELRTPLAILQGELEAKMRNSEVDIGSNTRMLDEIRRLKALTHSLLFLSKTDSGTFELTRSPFELNQVLEQVVGDMSDLYSQEDVSIEFIGSSAVTINGDSSLVQQAIMNLVRNAVKFNRKDGIVICSLKADSRLARISVGNTGPGISPSYKERIFERFFRIENDRNRDRGGSGLGLNIAREIARIHGGDVLLVQSEDDWTEFLMTLCLES